MVEKNTTQVSISYLYEHKIKPCTDCRHCKQGDLECTVKDDAARLFAKIENAELIIFGTPIYWFGPTAVMKLLIDRLRPYYKNQKLKGKKAALLLPAGSGAGDCDLTIEMFKRIFKALEIEYLTAITAEAYNEGDISENSAVIETLRDFVKQIK